MDLEDLVIHQAQVGHPSHGYLAGQADLGLLCVLLHRQSQGVHYVQVLLEGQLDLVNLEVLEILVDLLIHVGLGPRVDQDLL